MTDEVKKKDIGYAFRIGAQTAEGISIDITGNFGVNAPDEVINKELDKWINIFSRQRAKTVLLEEQKLLSNEKKTHAQFVEQLRQANETAGTKTAEVQARASLKQNVDRLEATIKAREEGIASLEKLTI
jgi:hypothetical protein